jgi:voltage-gated potassium channel
MSTRIARARHRLDDAGRMSFQRRGGTVANETHERASNIEEFLERHSPGYQYGWVLLLLSLTFIVMAAGPPNSWTRVSTVLLQGLTLCAALLASRVRLRWFRFAAVIALVSLLAAIASVLIDNGRSPDGGFFLLNMLLVATVPWVIARALWRRKVIDVRTVLGAVCIYVLLGMLFAFLFTAIDSLSSGPFFVQTSNATTPDFLYFSYITQTTVGYGDLTARGDFGRALAVLEAMFGQLYLVTVIAVLVSRLSTGVLGARPPAAEPMPETKPASPAATETP